MTYFANSENSLTILRDSENSCTEKCRNSSKTKSKKFIKQIKLQTRKILIFVKEMKFQNSKLDNKIYKKRKVFNNG